MNVMNVLKRSNAICRPILACFALAGLLAVSNAPVSVAKSLILTKAAVKRFVASYPDVKSVAEKHAAQKGTSLAGAKDHLAALIDIASDEAAIQEIDTAVQAHGFEDTKQWISVAESVGRAYAHIKAGSAKGKAERKLEKAIAKIEKNSILSDGQKAKLIKALREGADAVLEAPPPENVAAVEPMVADIDAVMQ